MIAVSVQWNRQKKFYDTVLLAGVAAYLAIFGVLTKMLFPHVTDEIMLMRAFGTAAFLLLHVILCIGPLCRLNPKFLPLLYNRRHAGVTMFTLGLIHAILVVITYHAGGDTNPILSIFKGSPLNGSVSGVPFRPCITCPWHGYQYQPDTGASPPPFVEKVQTFNIRVKNGRVFVHPKPNPAGTRAEPARASE